MKYFDFAKGCVATVVLVISAAAAAAQQAYDPMRPPQATPAPDASLPEGEGMPALNPEFENLPDTAGVEETYYQCVACHSTAIIKQQRISDARWEYLWDWMVDDQGMPETDAETKETILTYLKTHFSSER